MPAARKSFPTMLGISRYGQPDLGKGVFQLSLSQEEIPVAPGNLGRKWIDARRFEESLPGLGAIAFEFKGRAEVKPGVGRVRIERDRSLVGPDGARQVGLLDVVLPIVAE